MAERGSTVRVSIDVALDTVAAFDALVDEVGLGLARRGLHFVPGPDGRVTEGAVEAGRVEAWSPGSHFTIAWRPAGWDPAERARVSVRLEPGDGGTRVTVELGGWGGLLGEPGEVLGWFGGEVVSPLLAAAAPVALGDWITDRRARRPSGAAARATYGDPLYHYPNFRVLIEELALTGDDDLLEVGCGGGALLAEALESGCRAAAVDHSADMVALTRATNREAVAEGRLEVVEAKADRLPFPDGRFTAATMTGVLGFLPDPVAVFAEIRRVLRLGGRFVGTGSDPKLKGTPAAPEPMASRLRFYDSAELKGLARAAGFEDVRIVERDLAPHARAVGVPEEHLPLFEGPSSFLLARRVSGTP